MTTATVPSHLAARYELAYYRFMALRATLGESLGFVLRECGTEPKEFLAFELAFEEYFDRVQTAVGVPEDMVTPDRVATLEAVELAGQRFASALHRLSVDANDIEAERRRRTGQQEG